jgi:hypothetical protein
MYHSVMILLPNGKVMMSGWENDSDSNTIEIYCPPYLFKGPRPVISGAPTTITRGSTFTVSTADATTITKVTLVKPMAVTHQTETNQRVLELSFLHDHVHPDNLIVTAPTGGINNSNAPGGYYMLFIINGTGVPSEAKWVKII